MPNGITFNGVHSSQMQGVRVVTDYNKDLLPDMENRLLSIPMRDGVIDMGYNFKERVIPVSFILDGTNISNYFQNAEKVAKWLNTGVSKPLQLDAMPNRTWIARPMSKIIPERFASIGRVDVEFLVPDVAADGVQINHAVSQGTVYTYNGTYKTFPTITITVKEALTQLQIILNGDKFILVNRSFAVDDIIVIDTKNRKITLNGATDLRPDMDVTSDWFLIGEDYRFNLNSAASTIQIVFAERWL